MEPSESSEEEKKSSERRPDGSNGITSWAESGQLSGEIPSFSLNLT